MCCAALLVVRPNMQVCSSGCWFDLGTRQQVNAEPYCWQQGLSVRTTIHHGVLQLHTYALLRACAAVSASARTLACQVCVLEVSVCTAVRQESSASSFVIP
jgi:hypothetical protein